MGNQSSSEEEEYESEQKDDRKKSPPKARKPRRPVRGSVYAGYKSSSPTARQRKEQKPSKKSSRPNGDQHNSDDDSDDELDNVSVSNPKMKQQAPTTSDRIAMEKAATPSGIHPKVPQKLTEIVVPNTFDNSSFARSVPANSFEKAPVIPINYVVKPPERDSRHTYDLTKITVIQRTSVHSNPIGHRWYDFKNNKPPVT